MKARTFHRLLGLALFAFILNASVTGVLRANAKWLYWKDRPFRQKPVALTAPSVGIGLVFEVSQEVFGPETRIGRVELKLLAQKPFYLVAADGPGKKVLLVDATSGQIIPRIDPEMAVQIAKSFVGEQGHVDQIEEIAAFRARKASEARPVYRILFDDPTRTEVFVDQRTGESVSILDRGRRFGLWVARFHELDFSGMSQIALTLLGLGLCALTLVGVRLGLGGKKTRNTQEVLK